jgi:4-hydroxy-tetrahydrodipicolinate reductase
MIQVVVHGAEGRMGRHLTDLVDGAADCELAGLVTEPGRAVPAGEFHPDLPLTGQDTMAARLPRGCVVIDFSLAPALEGLLAACETLEAPLVMGTTGHTEAQLAALARHAERLPVVHAPNFSVGIPTLKMVLQLLARVLPGEFDAEQVETHHVTKLDKPSGTARHLADAWREARGGDAVPTHSRRLGGVIGEHTWAFADGEETLVVEHRAHSRRAFLRGVLPAVRFATAAEPGLYDLGDVLKGLGS